MASDNHIPPAEDLGEAESELLTTALAGSTAPASEATGAGGKAWAAFFDIRDAEHGALGRMSISAVVKRAGVARTPFATKGGRFRLLRQAIRERMLLEGAARLREKAEVGPTSPDEDAASATTSTKEELRRRLQVADSINAAYAARALMAERAAKEERRKAQRYLAELNDRDAMELDAG